MIRSLHLPSLTDDLAAGLRMAVERGFTHVDVLAVIERPRADLEALADSGLVVAAADLCLGPEYALGSESLDTRRAAVEIARRQIADAARLGATVCCLESPAPSDPAARARFEEAFTLLGEHAAARWVRLGVPGPGGDDEVFRDRQGRVVHLRTSAAELGATERLAGTGYSGAIGIRVGGSSPPASGEEGLGGERSLQPNT